MTSIGSVISFPIPPYSNVPINAQYFQPSQFVISNITLGITTIITTTTNMNYVIGQEIRLLIPPSFGSYQLNGATGYVISLPASNQVQVSIDSSNNVSPFVLSASLIQSAQIISVGDINNGIVSSTGRVVSSTNVPGAFINISPL